MTYYEHALISARKFKCLPEDTIHLHKLIDSSKLYFPSWQHRIFSHNMWFISVLVELLPNYIENSLTGEKILTRDVLIEHLKEDFNGKTPDLKDWLECIEFKTDKKWINFPDMREIKWLRENNLK